MKNSVKIGHIQRFLERRNHLINRINEMKNQGKQLLRHDVQEIEAIEWLLVSYSDLEIENGEDLELKNMILSEVPIEKFRKATVSRAENRKIKKQESSDRRNYRKAMEKIKNGEPLGNFEKMAFEKLATKEDVESLLLVHIKEPTHSNNEDGLDPEMQEYFFMKDMKEG